MTRILIYEPAYRRVAARLAAHPGLEILVMAKDGLVSLNGEPVAPGEAAPEVGWTSVELFGDAPMREYATALLASPALKWVQTVTAGIDNPVFGRFMAAGARLTTNHTQSVGISEYVMTTVLDHFQRGPERRAAQARRDWARLPYREVCGATWLIVGFGAIGQGVARKARAFDARVIGVRRAGGTHEHADRIVSPEAVAGFLPQADVVVLSLPLSARTAGMVDEAFLAAMKPGSVLVNVGRGGLVDEAALLTALDRGAPGFAILDVFQTEPLPADSPFWSHPRVALTGHSSALGDGLTARSDQAFLDNLARFLAGQPLINEVDPGEATTGRP